MIGDSSSDQDLIALLRDGNGSARENAFKVIYLKHKRYCLNFMKSKFKQLEELTEDIYHNAVIVLCENVNKPGWQLQKNCKIRTFLCSVCFHQGLTELGRPTEPLGPEDDVVDVTDGYLPMEEPLNAERVGIIVAILNDRAKTSEVCYDILTRRFYRNQSYEIISREMCYKNARTAITRSYRCLQKLRKEIDHMLGKK